MKQVLKRNPKISFEAISFYGFFFVVNLSKYLARNTTIMSIPCAPAGQYDIIVATASNIQLKLNVTQQKPFLAQKLLQYVQTSRIRYENRLHKRQVLFKWDKR